MSVITPQCHLKLASKTGPWRRPQWPAVALSLAAVMGAAPERAGAQAAAGPAMGEMEEIVVYARRRDERLQETPVAISVRTGEQLREENAQRFEDVAREVPNVRMVSSPQSVSALDVTIRGQTVNRSAIVFDPAVGLYVDGVYLANGQATMATMLDIADVEVVRGSQGTLSGRNNTGGSIFFRTNRPDLTQYSAEAALGGGEYGTFMGRAILNLPVSDQLALRFAYQDNQREGWGESVATGQDNLGNQHRYQARFGALWKPADSTEAYLTYEHFEANEGGAILHPLAGPAPGTLIAQLGGLFQQFPIPGLPTVTFPTDPYKTDGSYPSYDRAKNDLVHLTVTQGLGNDLSAKLILGYRHLDTSTALDVDASTLPLADTTLGNTSNQKSAELQLSGKSFEQKLDWVGGLYWFRDDGSAPSVQAPASPEFLAALGALAEATGGQVDLGSYFSPVPVYETNSARNDSKAIYLHGEYHLTPDWAVAAGVRRTEDGRELKENSYVVIPGMGENCTILDLSLPPPYQIQGPCPPIHKSVDYGFWSWEFSTRYRFNDQLNGYLRIGRSQRSGGWNAPLATLQDQPFRPEQLTDYELGLKADLLGGALRVNTAVFYGDYQDMQRLLPVLVGNTPTTLVINAGNAHVGGAEIEATWQVTRALSLLGSFGWTDAKYTKFEYSPVPGEPPLDLSHNDFYQTPRYEAALALAYEVPTPLGRLKLRTDYAWQDKVEFNVVNDFNYQPAYGTWNARVALAGDSNRWELAVYGNNLADTRYAYTGGTISAPGAPAPSIAWNIPGERRVVGVEAMYRWAGPR